MYNNSGAKVKGLATTLATLLIIGSILLGICVMAVTESFLIGALVMAFGCLTGWLSGLLLAAFGEMVENTYYLRKMMAQNMGYEDKEAAQAEEAKNPDDVSADVVREIMHRDGIGIGDAMIRAKAEKAAALAKEEVEIVACPKCGTPRKGQCKFCINCGTRLE